MRFRADKYRKLARIQKRWGWNWMAYPFRKNKVNKSKKLRRLKAYQASRHSGPEPAVCHAPTRSIYFGFDGKTVPCCFNREYIYGIYPEKTVSEIIHGEKRIQLQNYLNQHDFSHGCHHCSELIKTGNFDGVEARLYDGLKHNKNGYPTEMIFELDNTCNLECIMCEGRFSSSILKNREGKDYLPGPYDQEFVRQLTPWLKHLEVAKFMGGEPFLIKIHYDIWEAIIRENPRCVINLQTNGTVFNERIANLMEKARFQIGVSVDSLKKERFEAIRKNAVFENVMQNLEHFIAYGKRKDSFINLSVCPMQQNWDEIPDIVEFCNRKKIFVYFNTVYTSGFDLRELTSSQIKDVYETFRDTRIAGKGYIAKRNRRFFESLTKQIEDWYRDKKAQDTYTTKCHNMPREDFLALFSDKLPVNKKHLQQKIEMHAAVLPEIIFLSDAQLDTIKHIQTEEFVTALQQESDDSVEWRILNFIEHGNFSEH